MVSRCRGQATLALSTVLYGITPTSFNDSPAMQEAFSLATLATLEVADGPRGGEDEQVTTVDRIENIVAVAVDSRRRLEDATGSTISFDAITVITGTDDAEVKADSYLATTITALEDAISSGNLMTAIESQESGSLFEDVEFDVEASVGLNDEVTVSINLDGHPTPNPTYAPSAMPSP